jgi:hypothetical protein
MGARCPSCDLPLTSMEAMDSHCPSCGRALPAVEDLYPESKPWYPRPARQARPAQRGGGAAAVLFCVAALQILGGAALVWLANMNRVPMQALLPVFATIGIVFMVYIGLGAWALHDPRPAAVVGLVLYVLMFAAGLALNPWLINKGLAIHIGVFVGLVMAIRQNSTASSQRGCA